MASITQDMRYRLSRSVSPKNMVSQKQQLNIRQTASIFICWKRRHDGINRVFRDRSRVPHHHPNQHTPEEIKLIQDMRRRNPILVWLSLGLQTLCSAVINVPSQDCIVF